MTTNTAHYKPMFGVGDRNSELIKGIKRFGYLIVDSIGKTNIINYQNEEQIIFILNGTGIIHYDKIDMPVSENDFLYIPIGTRFGFTNPRDKPITMLVMGFEISPDTKVVPTSRLMIANTNEVPFQVLGQHGPTTLFQLLMGTTRSRRDRLAAAYQANSLFIMDFAETGTNIPHKHDREEEIYLILEGVGDIVAGEEISDSTEIRHPAKPGDAFFFSPSTLIGFYSGTKSGEKHAKILAVRFRYPLQLKEATKRN
jgi:mannose-6-phosphate isomerase-like protein (cupin superfamily)